ncbi:MAG: hypothetical protein NVV59_03605 [Chitinophagaceae bacterium]|nr:hypothetical protein [Chitinophagaceae bacterium]
MIHSVRFTAVLDTNVVYPLIIRDLLFWFAYHDLYTPKWSEHIFDEWKKVMIEKGVSEEEATRRIQKANSAPDQPIFYPVMNEEYAIQISREWNVPAYGVGYVVKLAVRKGYLEKFNVENVGGQIHNELWVPAEELEEFNSNIVGLIEVTKEFRG